MKNFFFAVLFLISNFLFSQINFEKGYYITNTGEKKDILIKNYDWKNNPSSIEYKINENDTHKSLKTSEIQEFSVGNLKYNNAKVMIDRSSKNINSLSITSEFNDKEEILLLKTLVEGKTNLYEYYDGFLTRFFYKKNDEDFYKQLAYKEYMEDEKYIRKNEAYKKQLTNEFSDNDKISPTDINKLSYQEKDLVQIFQKYNNFSETEMTEKKNNFHFYIKPGVGFSTYKILPPTDNNSIGVKESSAIMFRIGAELEYILNFNKGKWAIFTEPSFQTVNFTVNDYNKRNFAVKFSSIQIPLGLKYNMFLNQKSKIYVSTSIYYNLMLNKDNFTIDNYSIKPRERLYRYSIGIGYNYDKFGVEIKYGVTPKFLTSYYGQYSDMTLDGFNLSLSYKLF